MGQTDLETSETALAVRQLLKQASDPNRFIFDDLPKVLGEEAKPDDAVDSIVNRLEHGLVELRAAYREMLRSLSRQCWPSFRCQSKPKRSSLI